MNIRLENKRALGTGANSGIGAAIAQDIIEGTCKNLVGKAKESKTTPRLKHSCSTNSLIRRYRARKGTAKGGA